MKQKIHLLFVMALLLVSASHALAQTPRRFIIDSHQHY